MSPTNAPPDQFARYEPPQRLRLFLGILAVVLLLGALMNYRSWLVRDPHTDTRNWIAFISDRNGNDDLWVADGSGKLRAVTNDEADDESPVWMSQGNRIAFSSTRTNAKVTKEVYQLWSIRPDGSDVRGLTVGGGAKLDPHLSRDGKRILHIAQGFVTVVELDDTHAEQLIPAAEHPESLTQWRELVGDGVAFRRAEWAKLDESVILCQFGSDKDNALFLGLTGEAAPPLPALLLAAAKLDFAWSPNSLEFLVAYHGNRPLKNIIPRSPDYGFPESGVILFSITTAADAKAKQLPVMLALGDKPDSMVLTVKTILKTSDKGLILEPNYSADGLQIAYVDAEADGETLKRRSLAVFASANLESKNVTPSLIARGTVSSPKWSPDGRKLAYLMLNRSRRDLWTVDMPEATNARNLTNGLGDNHDISWSPQ